MSFENPSALWLLALLPFALLGIGLVESATKRDSADIFRLDRSRLRKSLVEKYILAGLLAALLVGAMALPKVLLPAVEPPKRAGEVMLLVDVSASMAAQKDLTSPNRLQRVKPILYEIIRQLEAFGEVRISLVGYTSIARSLVPFVGKPDFPYLKESIKRVLGINAVPGEGSSLGRALLNVAGKFDPDQTIKLIVLFGDGEVYIGERTGMNDTERGWIEEGIGKVREANIKVITVGLGEREGAKIPLFGREGFTGQYAKMGVADYVTTLEEGNLKEIASRTGSKYFPETDQAGLVSYIQASLVTPDPSRPTREVMAERSIAPWFLFAAVPFWLILARRHLLG